MDYRFLPTEFKEELCISLLDRLGIDNVRHNPITHELTHGCVISDYHSDQERNPTCSLNYEKLVVKCLGCQASGSLLWFVATVRDTTWDEARKWLYGQAGESVGSDLSMLVKYYDVVFGEKVEKEPIPTYSSRAIEVWQTDSHPYFDERGISKENAQRFGLGWDYKRNALIIPHYWKGDLVGWQTRFKEPRGSKYVNTPSLPKRNTIFNFDREARKAVIVEAPISVVRHEGIAHFEATFGASVTKEQIRHMDCHDNVYLWMDNDESGWRAMEKIGKALMSRTNVWVVDSPFSGDPGDLSAEMVEAILSSEYVVPFVTWRRPEVLLCHKCYNAKHDGRCG